MRRLSLVVLVAVVLAFLAAAGEVRAARHWGGRYRVRPGDSLTLIAHRYRVSLHMLARTNGLDWRRALLVGIVLRVPSPGNTSIRLPVRYFVQPGDTLSGIAERYRVSLGQLAAANGLDPAGVLLAGSRLVIPTRAGISAMLAHVGERDPYRHGEVGYDASYPNCSLRLPAADFAVIGLNGGRPFTSNRCFEREWLSAPQYAGVYINTAYDKGLLAYASQGCLAAAARQRLSPPVEHAYALGCSEAEYDLRLLSTTRTSLVWLDVEPSNAWSRRDLNAATIRGIITRFLEDASNPTVGIYSNRTFWNGIVGSWSSLSVPEWIAPSAPDPPGCASGFAAGPVWLAQNSARRLDHDTAC